MPQPGTPILFVDDGDVMSDNTVRGPQWQRLVGEFLAPVLGGEPEAWSQANRVVAERQWQEYARTMFGGVDMDYEAHERRERLAWLTGMCDLVGVQAPSEAECFALVGRTRAFVTRRVRAAVPGVVEALRGLASEGYTLHTASGEHSEDLDGYLVGMGVRHCFERLYGPDLVNTAKEGPEYYERIFAHAGAAPERSLVVDDKPRALDWAARAGAGTVLIGSTTGGNVPARWTIPGLADLSRLLRGM